MAFLNNKNIKESLIGAIVVAAGMVLMPKITFIHNFLSGFSFDLMGITIQQVLYGAVALYIYLTYMKK